MYALGRSSIAIGSDDNAAYYSESDQITSYDRANYFNTLYTNIDPSGSKYGYDSTGKLVKSSVTKYSPTLAQGDGSIAIGSRSLAYASGATALGTLAFALKPGSTAIGTKTRAEGESALAFGNNTYVFANYTIGVGSKTQVLNSGGTAYGYKTYSGSKGDIAIGTNVYSGVSMETGLTTAQPNSNLGSLPVISAFGLYNIDPVKGARSILGVDNGVTTNISMSAAGLTSVPTSAQQYFDVNQSYIKNLDNIISSEYSGSGAYTGLASIAANTQTLNGVTGIVQTSNGEYNGTMN